VKAGEGKYLAVDVDVRSRRSLASLLAAWPNAQTPGRANRRAPLWLVLSGVTAPKGRYRARDTADFRVKELVRVIETLPTSARRCWDAATHRTFDIGIILITVYPSEPD
jgi:hypothetical protein